MPAEAIAPTVDLPAYAAYTACMQYTLRKIPPALDAALRQRARRERKSLNRVALDALEQALGFTPDRPRRRDLSDICGTWKEDPEFDRAVAEQHRIDPGLWK